MTLTDRIDQLVRYHGSLQEVARVTGIDAAYLWRMARGQKCNPSRQVLESLGLMRVVDYRPLVRPAKDFKA